MNNFMYKTVRAEYHVEVWAVSGKGQVYRKPVQKHGPYPTLEWAEQMIISLKPSLGFSNTVNLVYREVPVQIDPIVNEILRRISDKVWNWVDNKLIHKKSRRKQIYFSENVIRQSLKQLASDIQKESVSVDLENPHAET